MQKTKYNKGLLIALIIGDGYLRPDSQLAIEHSAKQFEYVLYKKELVEKILGCVPINLRKRSRLDKRTNKIYTGYSFVKGHRYFHILRRFIYPNNKKTLSKAVLNFLTPQGLAIWYMDDGFLNYKLASLATYCSEEEADIIINFFKEKFDLDIRKYWHKGNSAYYHAFDVPSSNKFFDLIYEFIIPSMKYKIPCSYIPRVLDNI